MQALSPDETAIVLVHGFGAGVFAWRNIMQPLADAAGCRVIAFDRPAFGPFLSLAHCMVKQQQQAALCACSPTPLPHHVPFAEARGKLALSS